MGFSVKKVKFIRVLKTKASYYSKAWLPGYLRNTDFTGKKSVVLEIKGVGVMSATDWTIGREDEIIDHCVLF